jgi:hypothetical protein
MTISLTSSCKKQINKQNSYLLLAFLQSGSVPKLDMHGYVAGAIPGKNEKENHGK